MEPTFDPPSSDPLALFSKLFAALRVRGFEVGAAEYLKAHEVIQGLQGPVRPRRVKHLIGPIVVRSPDEQERFYSLFDEIYPELTDTERPPVMDPEESLAAVEVSRARSASRGWRRWTIAALGVVGIAVATVLFTRPPEEAEPSQTATQTTGPSAAPTQTPEAAEAVVVPTDPQVLPQPETASGPHPTDEADPDWSPTREQLSWLTILGSLLVFTILELRARRNRHAVVEAHRTRGPPLTWQTFEPDAPTQFYDSGEVRGSVRALLRRESGEAKFLSIRGTIQATIRALGYPTLQLEPRTRAPEYLALVQRYSPRDHQASLTDHLIASLEAEDLPVERYYFDSVPRICYRAIDEEPVRLEELGYRYDTSRLLIFGDGTGLLHPVTGRLERWVEDLVSWPRRALLTPVPLGLWAGREVQLASHFVVAGATPEGLASAVDLFEPDTEWSLPSISGTQQKTGAIPENASMEEMANRLGESAFRLLAACAAYPELHWDLTVQIAALPEVAHDGIDDVDLAKLFQLSWFRRGRIPEETRAALLDRLAPEVESAVRQEIVRLIRRNLAPAGSVAGEEQRAHVALQRVLAATGGLKEKRNALRELRKLPPDLSQRDEAGVRLLERREGSRLSLSLPEPLKEALFPRGGALFGMRSAGRLALTGITMLFGLGAVWTTDTRGVIDSITVTVLEETMEEGTSQPYRVEMFDAAGELLLRDERTIWIRATSPAVLVEAAGNRVTARTEGTAYLVASVGGLVDSARVIVQPSASLSASPVESTLSAPVEEEEQQQPLPADEQPAPETPAPQTSVDENPVDETPAAELDSVAVAVAVSDSIQLPPAASVESTAILGDSTPPAVDASTDSTDEIIITAPSEVEVSSALGRFVSGMNSQSRTLALGLFGNEGESEGTRSLLDLMEERNFEAELKSVGDATLDEEMATVGFRLLVTYRNNFGRSREKEGDLVAFLSFGSGGWELTSVAVAAGTVF
jgi:hypothetical protein